MERIEKLERTVRCLVFALVAMSVVLGSMVVMGAAAKPGPVEGTSFVLLDGAIKRATLELDKDGTAVFSLNNGAGVSIVRATADKIDFGSLDIGAAKAPARVTLRSDSSGGSAFHVEGRDTFFMRAPMLSSGSFWMKKKSGQSIELIPDVKH